MKDVPTDAEITEKHYKLRNTLISLLIWNLIFIDISWVVYLFNS